MLNRLREHLRSWIDEFPILAVVVALAVILIGGLCLVVREAKPAPPTRLEKGDFTGDYFQDIQNDARAEAKIELGRHVYFDQGVCSLQGNMSCATCHNPSPELGYSNGQKIAVGGVITRGTPVGPFGQRNVPPLINGHLKLKSYTNYDGRTIGIAAPCLQAVADRLVLGSSIPLLLQRLNGRAYCQRLARVAYEHVGVTEEQLRECLVAFLCTIRSENTLMDRLARGEKPDLPTSIYRGWSLLNEKGCLNCHDPKHNWQNGKFHDIGIAQRTRLIRAAEGKPPLNDRGRGGVTGRAEDNDKFLTPSLVECGKTQPYGHDGSFATLYAIVKYKLDAGWYDLTDGTRGQARTIDPEIAAMSGTDDEARDIAAFLTVASQSPTYTKVENPFVKPTPAQGAR